MVPNQDVIRTADRPVAARRSRRPARHARPRTARFIKHGAATERLLRHEGLGRIVFEDLADMDRRLDDPMLDVDATDVLVLRKRGPVGAAMPEAGYIPIPRQTRGPRHQGHGPGLGCPHEAEPHSGPSCCTLAPEAAVGGPLALVRTGDIVRLDVPGRRLDVLVDPSVLEERRAAWRAPVLAERGVSAVV